MQKAILTSILALTVIIPTIAVRRVRGNPRLALKKAIFWMLLGICFYALSVIFIYPRFLA